MPLNNCEVNLILTWSSTCVITNSTSVGRFAITDTKFYVPVVTLSTKDNAKLLQQLKSGFKKSGYTTFIIIEKAKETVLDFSQRTVKVL